MRPPLRDAPTLQPAVDPMGSSHQVINEFGASRHIQKELAAYSENCHCTHAIEAECARLHASLERVLVIDARMAWNGLGNSLGRWTSFLRLGEAMNFATFLWLNGNEDGNNCKPPPHDTPPHPTTFHLRRDCKWRTREP